MRVQSALTRCVDVNSSSSVISPRFGGAHDRPPSPLARSRSRGPPARSVSVGEDGAVVTRSTSFVKLTSWRVLELCKEALCGRSGLEAFEVAQALTIAANAAGDLGHVFVSASDLVAVQP